MPRILVKLATLAREPQAYFNHQTALELHQLVAGAWNPIYPNEEQLAG
jgi:hypothetical protein